MINAQYNTTRPLKNKVEQANSKTLFASVFLKTFLFFVLFILGFFYACIQKDTTTTANQITINGKLYKTVVIGTQTWMAENLNDASSTAGISVCYNNSQDSCAKYGRLYDWDAAMNIDRKIAGWHLPTPEEWNILANALGGAASAGTKMKVGGSSGFNALFAGFQTGDGYSDGIGDFTDFWSSTSVGSSSAWNTYINSGNENLYTASNNTSRRFSVRLIKD